MDSWGALRWGCPGTFLLFLKSYFLFPFPAYLPSLRAFLDWDGNEIEFLCAVYFLTTF